jgi:hypothetical protein
MSKRALLAGLLSVSLVAAAAEIGVRLVDVPERVAVPLPEGANAVLTARVAGSPRGVWLATARDARARYMLDSVGDGEYQVNLADPVLSAILEASGSGQVRVFAEGDDGSVAESIAVSYTAQPSGRHWAMPPRVFVHTVEGVVEVGRLPPWLGDLEPALVAEMRGQSLAVGAPGFAGFAAGTSGREAAGWFDPAQVERIEARFDARAGGTSAVAKAGEQKWGLEPGEGTDPQCLTLAVGDDVRDVWAQAGELTVTCSQDGSADVCVALKVPPRKLDLPEGQGEFTVLQYRTEDVRGSGGYLQVHIGDITQGQTLLTLSAADGEQIVPRESVRQGDCVVFSLGDREYELEVSRLVNLLIGDDYAEFVVRPRAVEPQVEAAPAPEGRASGE